MNKRLIAIITPFIPLTLRGIQEEDGIRTLRRIFNQRPLLRLVLSKVEG